MMVELALLPPLLSSTLQTSEFGRDHHLISSTSSFHPLAEPLLAFSKLIIHRCVDEIAALLVEVIQHSKRCFLGTLAAFRTLRSCDARNALMAATMRASWEDDSIVVG